MWQIPRSVAPALARSGRGGPGVHHVVASVSRAGGLVDLVEHEVHGLLFEPCDRHGLTQAVARMLSDTGLRVRCGIAGRRKAQTRFSIEQMSKKYLEIYNRVLSIVS